MLFQQQMYSECCGSTSFYVHEKLPHAASKISFTSEDLKSADAIAKALSRLAGFYFGVVESLTEIAIFVDQIRSCPVFYSFFSGEVVISDSYDALSRLLPNQRASQSSVRSFLNSGFVIGRETLHPEIFQVEAGSIIFIRKSDGDISTGSSIFSKPMHTARGHDPVFSELDSVVSHCFEDLATRANGRQIVIPLSGGFDSRLVAVKLKEVGYDNIIAFSYGHPENPESKSSRQVAADLGINWKFVHYEDALVRDLWRSDERRAYRDFASNGVSLPHYQDFFALHQLKSLHIINEDAIIVPGHTGDFISGDHLPPFAFSEKPISSDELIDFVLRTHCDLWRLADASADAVRASLDAFSINDCVRSEIAANIVDSFNWKERQAKFIVNSCRVYEFFGYDWWLPLWDRKFLDYWTEVPLRFKKNRWWYIKFVEAKCAQLNLRTTGNAGTSLGRRIAKHVFSTLGIEDLLRRSSTRTSWKVHPLNPYAILDDSFVEVCAERGSRLNGCYTADYLNEKGLIKF